MKAIDAKEKRCKCCGKTYSTDDFYKQQQISPTGEVCRYYDTFCKSCRKDSATIRRQQFKIRAVAYKGGKCVDCGYDEPYPEVFDFHHIDPTTKEFAVFKIIKSWKKTVVELDKCELLCANCHRKRHKNLST
jgi:hypothetical protein